MTRIIHCIRHGQGIHNISPANHHLQDPPLTLLGEQQCHEVAATFPSHDQIELVITSPLLRTIHTALLSFAPALKRGVQVLALPLLQEASTLPCDTGRDLDIIKKELKDSVVDFSLVQEGWHLKVGTSTRLMRIYLLLAFVQRFDMATYTGRHIFNHKYCIN